MCVCAYTICIYTYQIFLIQFSVDEQMGCFHVLTIVNNVFVNTEMHVSFQMTVFIFSGYIPRSGIVGVWQKVKRN